jgi:periodic tryptophan protein 1
LSLTDQGKNKGGLTVNGHTKEVMGLAWNRLQRNVLASSSADCTVRLWDLTTATSLRVFDHHRDKVRTDSGFSLAPTRAFFLAPTAFAHLLQVAAVRWNTFNAPVMLTGSFDRSVAVLDSRSPQVKETPGIFNALVAPEVFLA